MDFPFNTSEHRITSLLTDHRLGLGGLTVASITGQIAVVSIRVLAAGRLAHQVGIGRAQAVRLRVRPVTQIGAVQSDKPGDHPAFVERQLRIVLGDLLPHDAHIFLVCLEEELELAVYSQVSLEVAQSDLVRGDVHFGQVRRVLVIQSVDNPGFGVRISGHRWLLVRCGHSQIGHYLKLRSAVCFDLNSIWHREFFHLYLPANHQNENVNKRKQLLDDVKL